MLDLLEKARNANCESKQIEFKSTFDPYSGGEWCEIIKDIVAIANSGGGILIFGLNNDGTNSPVPVDAINKIDQADVVNKITKYTGWHDPQIEIRKVDRGNCRLPAFLIESAGYPVPFERPGTYNAGDGKQKSAFGIGTVYFRHGSKSEPATSADIHSAFDRQLNAIRRSWLNQVRRVSRAPIGSQIIITQRSGDVTSPGTAAVRVVMDSEATPVVLTRDKRTPGATFMHEEVSEQIFDEINNVVDANRILSKGQKRFYLGAPVYYRIYAERLNVKQDPTEIETLFHAGACEFYAPNLFWATQMDVKSIAETMQALFLAPKSPQIHWFMRTAVLLGREFCNWVCEKWDSKWLRHSQPPTFYFSFKNILSSIPNTDQILLAAHYTSATRIIVPGESEVSCSELLEDREKANRILTAACMAVFQGEAELRSTARDLDFLVHGSEIAQLAKPVTEAVIRAIGERLPAELDSRTKIESDVATSLQTIG